MAVFIHNTLKEQFKTIFPSISMDLEDCSNYDDFINIIKSQDGDPDFYNKISLSLNMISSKYSNNENLNKIFFDSLKKIYDSLLIENENYIKKIQDLELTNSDLEFSFIILQNTIEKSDDGICVLYNNKKKFIFNKTLINLFDLEVEEFSDLSNNIDINKLVNIISKRMDEPKKLLDFIKNIKKDKDSLIFETKDKKWIELQVILIQKNNEVLAKQCIFRNITKLKEKELNNTKYDHLTNLPNKNELKNLINNLINDKISFSLASINLDDFKYINNSMGNELGDELLVILSKKILSIIDEDFHLFRGDGDEFIILIDNQISIDYLKHISQKIIDYFKNSFKFNNINLYLTVSIGLTFIENFDLKFTEILNQSHLSLSYAKNNGGSKIVVYKEEFLSSTKEELFVKNDIIDSLEKNEFYLVYQPKINNSNNTMIGVEALIRCNKNGNHISPMKFIPIAESTGLIIPLTEWVIDEVFSSIKTWEPYLPKNKNNEIEFQVSINVSAKHFEHDDLIPYLIKSLDKYNISSKLIDLEITESSFAGNFDKVIDTLSRLRDLGFSLSIDDFGTGYSSLSYLQKMPINILKIDKSFILNMDKNIKSSSFVNAIIQMAHVLDVEVVAEGVETDSVHKKLNDLKCDYMQGFLFSRPQDKKELLSNLKQIAILN